MSNRADPSLGSTSVFLLCHRSESNFLSQGHGARTRRRKEEVEGSARWAGRYQRLFNFRADGRVTVL